MPNPNDDLERTRRNAQYDWDDVLDYDYYYGDYPYGRFPYGSSTVGRFSGVGPRGYKRSDDLITDDINDHLTWDDRIDATDIQVDVNEGIVTLTGSVETRRDKRIAEDIADDVAGVADVNNNLQIRNRSR